MESGRIFGDWEIKNILNRGTVGVVGWLKNVRSGDSLALKMCRHPQQNIQKSRQNWTREVEAMRKARNDNIVKVKSIPEDLESYLSPLNASKLPLLCTEYCDGGNLRSFLSKPENVNGLPENEVRCILTDIKNALIYIHKYGIIHRNLKPEGIVLKCSSNPSYKRTFVYQISNLGYAKDINVDTISSGSVGSLQYIAPELFYSRTYDKSVDYWSFGLVAFEAVCGIRPFFPNMAPVQWMIHVKSKTANEICGYEKLDGKIEFSSELFSENHVSNRFKSLLENWFKIALEWDPKKRGLTQKSSEKEEVCHNTDYETFNRESEILCDLEKILNKVIITVFSVPTYEYLSYAVENNTSVATLQEWVEKETKIMIDDQIYISGFNLSVVSAEKFVLDYYNENLPVMLYLYKKDCLIQSNIKLNISSNIQLCLEDPKKELNYFHLSSVMRYVHFLILKEKNLYNSLIKASVLRLEYLRNTVRDLYLKRYESEKEMSILIDKNGLLSKIMTLDNQKINEMESNSNQMKLNELQSWIFKANLIQEDVTKLREAWNQIVVRFESIVRRCNEIPTNEIYSKQANSDFDELYRSIHSLIASSHSIPKNERVQNKSGLSSIKLVYKCLKLRENLLNNISNDKAIQIMGDIHTETRKIDDLITIVGKKAKSLTNNANDLILERDLIMWKLLESRNNANIQRSDQRTVKSLIEFKVGEPVRSNFFSLIPDSSTIELHSLINDNIKLRRDAEDFISSSHRKHATIIEELHKELKSLRTD